MVSDVARLRQEKGKNHANETLGGKLGAVKGGVCREKLLILQVEKYRLTHRAKDYEPNHTG